jgi:hypothetical protein
VTRRYGWKGPLLAATGLLVAADVSGESIFASVGFGRWNVPLTAAAAGRGDVSAVGPEDWGFSVQNPATLASMPRASAFVSAVTEITHVRGGGVDDRRADGRIPLLAVGMPFGRTVAALTLSELNDARYEISQPVGAGTGYNLRSKGDGAWSELGVAVARGLGPAALGVRIGIPFSDFREVITRSFESESGLSSRVERSETGLDEFVFVTLGARYRVRRADLAVFGDLPSEGEVVTRRAGAIDTSYALEIPPAVGIAASCRVGSRLTALAEYRRRAWSDVRIDGADWRTLAGERALPRGFKDVDAWGVGLELSGRPPDARGSVWSKTRWRAGYGVLPWNTAGPRAGRLVERTITVGAGVPFSDGSGALDLAVRQTFRRESGSDLEERVLSFMVGISFSRQPREF